MFYALINFRSLKTRSHDPFSRIRFLVAKIGSRRSDGPISRFRFCGENVRRSFVVYSHDPFFRTNKQSSLWPQNDHINFVALFIFQGECRMKIEHVLFSSGFFSKLRIRVIILNVFTRSVFRTNKNRILKNGSCERAFNSSNYFLEINYCQLSKSLHRHSRLNSLKRF